MEKPVTIIREELRQSITSAINESNLPAFVVADMFEGFLRELRALERQQYAKDVETYKASADLEKERAEKC